MTDKLYDTVKNVNLYDFLGTITIALRRKARDRLVKTVEEKGEYLYLIRITKETPNKLPILSLEEYDNILDKRETKKQTKSPT